MATKKTKSDRSIFSEMSSKENIIISEDLVGHLPEEFISGINLENKIFISEKEFAVDIISLSRTDSGVSVELSISPLTPTDFIDTQFADLKLKNKSYNCELVSHRTDSDHSNGAQLVVFIRGA